MRLQCTLPPSYNPSTDPSPTPNPQLPTNNSQPLPRPTRLWRELPPAPTDESSTSIEQANLYQAPDKMAGSACTRFAPYLRADATRPGAVRADGYGLRSWTFDAGSELVAVSGGWVWVCGCGVLSGLRALWFDLV